MLASNNSPIHTDFLSKVGLNHASIMIEKLYIGDLHYVG